MDTSNDIGFGSSMNTSNETRLRTLESIICDLEREGLINDYFRLAAQLKKVNGPYFFANLILTFISDTRNTIIEMDKILNEDPMDFEAMDQLAIKLKGSSSCIGAMAITRSCTNLRHAVEVQSHIGCIEAKKEIQCNFGRVHARLDMIAQLEQTLLSQQ